MNRKQRRAEARKAGMSWQEVRDRAMKIARQRSQEASIVAAAARLTPAQARQALAEWAANGVKQ